MNFHLHRPTETTLGAGVATALALAALAMLASSFQSDDDAPPPSGEHDLASTFDRLGFSHAFAYSEVMQAASDAVLTRVIRPSPKQAAF
jgi:hypothetical protein